VAEEDVVLENAGSLHLRATSRVSQAFSRLNLFVNNQVEMPVNPNAVIKIPKNISFESYTSSNGQLYAAGAFSFSENPVTEAKTGRYCSIGRGLSVTGDRHPMEEVTSSSFTYCYFPNFRKAQFVRAHEQLLANAYPPKMPPIPTPPLPQLGHDVWIGQQVILKRGVTLHTGCVVGAGSVVTKDVPAYTIVAGNPARAIRKRFSSELSQRLLATEWWNYHPKVLFEFERAEPVRFVMRMEAALAEGSLEPLPVRSLTWKDVLQQIEEL
jgi:acetyltransferase-like isoleucine patch superfamily enzyme